MGPCRGICLLRLWRDTASKRFAAFFWCALDAGAGVERMTLELMPQGCMGSARRWDDLMFFDVTWTGSRALRCFSCAQWGLVFRGCDRTRRPLGLCSLLGLRERAVLITNSMANGHRRIAELGSVETVRSEGQAASGEVAVGSAAEASCCLLFAAHVLESRFYAVAESGKLGVAAPFLRSR